MTRVVVEQGTTQVVVGPEQTTLVHSAVGGTRVVQRDASNLAAVVPVQPVAVRVGAAEQITRTLNVGTPGPAGPPGPRGSLEGTTDDLAEGAQHLYFTAQRAADAAPVQSVNSESGAVVLSAADVGADPVGTGMAAAEAAMSLHLADPDPHAQYIGSTDVVDGGNF